MHPVDARNLEFYELVAARFSETRAKPWRGWAKITLPRRSPIRVLDAGCGNGRLYSFLTTRTQGGLSYLGVDFSPALLAEAAQAETRSADRVEWRELDLHRLDTVTLPGFDRIFLFGVLHHIADRPRREALLTQLGQRLAPAGELWVTAWRFADNPQYAPPVSETGPLPTEPGAQWLAFDGVGRRYCVSVDLNEIDRYPERCGLVEQQRFHADGRTGRMNLYLVYGRT